MHAKELPLPLHNSSGEIQIGSNHSIEQRDWKWSVQSSFDFSGEKLLKYKFTFCYLIRKGFTFFYFYKYNSIIRPGRSTA